MRAEVDEQFHAYLYACSGRSPIFNYKLVLMSYSGSEPVELLALRARLCGITTEAQTITELSAQMRKPTDPVIQALVLKIWLADVRQAQDSSRLLALLYLANDVIQLLRGSEQSIIYRYNFAAALAEAILIIRQRAPALISKIARVLSIFRDRTIYDTHTLSLLQRVLQENLQSVTTNVLPTLRAEISTEAKIQQRLNQLEIDILSKKTQVESSAAPNSSSRQRLPTPLQHTTSTVVVNVTPPPSLEDLFKAGQQLNLLRIGRRSQQAINLDAEVVSRIRGYRIPLSARINRVDAQLINIFHALLKQDREFFKSIEEKELRRHKEAGQSQFLLLHNRGSSSNVVSAKVLVLLKKEWNLRCEKHSIERSLYWHMISILDQLLLRWNRVQSIAAAVEHETQRRAAEIKRSETPSEPQLQWPNSEEKPPPPLESC